MKDNQSKVMADNKASVPQGGVRQGAMKNTKVGNGGPKPSVKPLDTQTKATRDK